MVYDIVVRGHLSERVAAAFDELEIWPAEGTTTLHGDLVDQAALHGVIDRLATYGLVLLSVHGPDE